jgi:hypothetical protein
LWLPIGPATIRRTRESQGKRSHDGGAALTPDTLPPN